MFDFDQSINRRQTNCLKWDKANLFGLDRVEYPFWIADTDFATVPEVVEAMRRRCGHPLFGYNFPGEGCIPAVQGWYERRHGWHFETEEAFASVGVVTVLRFTLEAVTRPGDQVLIFTPVYNPFEEIIRNTGRVVADCPLRETGDSYEIDFEDLERRLAGGVKAIIFCNPHNPVGRVWRREELERLAGLCCRYDVLLLSDEVHGDIVLHGIRYTPMGTIPGIQDRLAVYTAVSKTFNLAGLGASCIIVPNPELRERIRAELKKAWIMSPNIMACEAMEAAYRHGDQWLDELNAYLTRNSDYVQAYLARYVPGLKAARHEGTFLMWLDFRCCGMDSDQVTRRLAREFGVGLGNGAGYGRQADGFMRFNIACPLELLKRGLEGIRGFCGKYALETD